MGALQCFFDNMTLLEHVQLSHESTVKLTDGFSGHQYMFEVSKRCHIKVNDIQISVILTSFHLTDGFSGH